MIGPPCLLTDAYGNQCFVEFLCPQILEDRAAIFLDDYISKGQLPGPGERYPQIIKLLRGWESYYPKGADKEFISALRKGRSGYYRQEENWSKVQSGQGEYQGPFSQQRINNYSFKTFKYGLQKTLRKPNSNSLRWWIEKQNGLSSVWQLLAQRLNTEIMTPFCLLQGSALLPLQGCCFFF